MDLQFYPKTIFRETHQVTSFDEGFDEGFDESNFEM